ncbi:MAG: PilZ domain-containing protein [Phycisphaerales bacterium]|nr:PilZ domain-containing protein [Phycisphaerales bacterium]
MSCQPSSDQRCAKRDDDLLLGMTSFVRLGDGAQLEGIVRDVSDGGVKIAGLTGDLATGHEVQLTLVVLGGEKVGCHCEVCHVEDGASYGLRFLARPKPIEEIHIGRCTRCDKEFAVEFKYCGYCGDRLHRISQTARA